MQFPFNFASNKKRNDSHSMCDEAGESCRFKYLESTMSWTDWASHQKAAQTSVFLYIWSWWILQTRVSIIHVSVNRSLNPWACLWLYALNVKVGSLHPHHGGAAELTQVYGIKQRSSLLGWFEMMICEMYKKLWPSINVTDSLMRQNKTVWTDTRKSEAPTDSLGGVKKTKQNKSLP